MLHNHKMNLISIEFPVPFSYLEDKKILKNRYKLKDVKKTRCGVHTSSI